MYKVLTVSVAAYNVEKYLNQALESFVCAPEIMDKIEVIIVNDGSKDSTAEIAREYEEKYPNTFHLIDKENGGYGSTINTSLPLAHGKYYKILDGDDWYNKEALPKYIKILEQEDSDVIFNDIVTFIEATGQLRKDKCKYVNNFTAQFTINDLKSAFIHNLAFKTERIKNKIGNITEHCFYTDAEYVMKCLICCNTCIYRESFIYCYRHGNAGQSTALTGYLKHIKEHETISKVVLQLYKENPKLKNLYHLPYAMAEGHLHLMMNFEPTTDNLKQFIEYRNFLKAYYPDAYSAMHGYGKTVAMFPKLLYRIMCAFKRRANGLS